jgi:hypothetical protein
MSTAVSGARYGVLPESYYTPSSKRAQAENVRTARTAGDSCGSIFLGADGKVMGARTCKPQGGTLAR